jgi:hypothetical protein
LADSGFGSLTEEKDTIVVSDDSNVGGTISPDTKPSEAETDQERLEKEQKKIELERFNRYSKMCYSGYHGMCTKGKNACGCSCHHAGKSH